MGFFFLVFGDMKVLLFLKNIYKEFNKDFDIDGFIIFDYGCLEKWVKNGVLLLNVILIVT